MSKTTNENVLQESKAVEHTIEEHAATLQIDAPVFAAVMQAERWSSGKRVPETVFKNAVKTFLGAPMGRR